jgi:chromosome segregation ATPase
MNFGAIVRLQHKRTIAMDMKNSITTTQQLLNVPRLEDVSEIYATLVARRADLTRRFTEVEAKIQANTQIIRERKRSQPKEPEVPNDRVAALLGEASPKNELPLEEENAKLRGEARDIQDAVNVLTERIAKARMEASATICRMIEPGLQELLSELATKMAEASHLAVEYQQLAQRLNEAQVAWSDLNPMGVRAGGVAEKGSQFSLWLMAAAQRGFISPSRLPKEIRI